MEVEIRIMSLLLVPATLAILSGRIHYYYDLVKFYTVDSIQKKGPGFGVSFSSPALTSFVASPEVSSHQEDRVSFF